MDFIMTQHGLKQKTEMGVQFDGRKLKREKNSKEEGDQSSPTSVDSP